jgi:LDH2 family malate/lactate/ureidoglycolate dehydrogenase
VRTLPAEAARQLSASILEAAGSPPQESRDVAEVLVRSNLAGHDSHGILRLPQYVEAIQAGTLRPGAPITVERETRATAVLEGNHGWGPVVARRAMELAIEKARAVGTGTVAVRGSQHIGRVGEYPSIAAAENMIGLAFVNSYGGGAMVVPWGGREARLAPNPISFAAPSGLDWPVLVDLTTSVIPEGKARLAHVEGRALPAGCLIDADGNPTTDPGVLYAAPRGALLPLGGPVGHKGTGLSLISELLGGVLSGAGLAGPALQGSGNGLWFQAINIADFLPLEDFFQTVQSLITWIKSSKPAAGFEEVLVPGEPEHRNTQRRQREGLPIDDHLWEAIRRLAVSVGVAPMPLTH